MNLPITLAFAYVSLLSFKSWLVASHARRMAATGTNPLPLGCMTIVQPILSGDPLLESRLSENLSALVGQSFLWLIDEDDSEAKRIAGDLRTLHPLADLNVEFCPPCPDATNPKLWKLHRAAGLVRTLFFFVLDDDTFLSASSAATLVSAATNHTVATGLPCYSDSGDLPSRLLAQFVNNNSVFTYLGTTRLVRPFTLNGMGYALRTGELSLIQNFEPIVHELTDDLALATLVLRQGGSICQSAAPLRVRTTVLTLVHYFQLMHRWYVFTLLLLQRQDFPTRLLIFVLHGLPPFLLVALFLATACSATLGSGLVLLGVLALRFLVLEWIQRRHFGCHLQRTILSIVSELLQPIHLVHAWTSRTIRWRTRHYRVRDTNDFSEA